jgi:hypothetical protein
MDFSSKKPSEVKFSANAVFSNRRPIKIYGVENWNPTRVEFGYDEIKKQLSSCLIFPV